MPGGLRFRDGIEVLGDWGSALTSKNADVVPHFTACENVVDTKIAPFVRRFMRVELEYKKNKNMFF